jgi:hypothetical protein
MKFLRSLMGFPRTAHVRNDNIRNQPEISIAKTSYNVNNNRETNYREWTTQDFLREQIIVNLEEKYWNTKADMVEPTFCPETCPRGPIFVQRGRIKRHRNVLRMAVCYSCQSSDFILVHFTLTNTDSREITLLTLSTFSTPPKQKSSILN